MINDDNLQDYRTILKAEMTWGLGEIQILHPPGTFALTPASQISIQAIGENQELLTGNGIDWRSGTGCLAIAAAKITKVNKVWGLEISEANVKIAQKNARLNGVEDKARFMRSNSYSPFQENDLRILDALTGQVNFILANPPASEGDDGFGYRRIVLKGARKYLLNEGLVFFSISYQYGLLRVERLRQEIPGFVYGGVLASTDWVPFDLNRPDLLHCLELYAQEESQGGPEYIFSNPEAPNDERMNAQSALAYFRRTGRSPLSKWQTHLFRYSLR